MSRAAGTLIAWTLAALVAASAATAEDFETYWLDLRKAAEIQDWDEVALMIKKHPLHAERSFWRAVDQFLYFELRDRLEPKLAKRSLMDRIADLYNTGHGDPDFLRYTLFVRSLDRAGKEHWRDSFEAYHEFVKVYWQAALPGKPDHGVVRKAIELHEKPLRDYGQLGDRYVVGMIHTCVGILQAKLEDYDAARQSFRLAHACWVEIGSDVQRALTESRLEGVNLLQGIFPDDLDSDLWEIVPMRYVVDSGGFPPTAHPYTVEEPLLWYRVFVPAGTAVNFHESYETQSESWSAYHDGVFERWYAQNSRLFPHLLSLEQDRWFLDLDDDGNAERGEFLGITPTRRVVELEGLRGRDGEPFRYAVELMEIVEATWFGLPKIRFTYGSDRAIAYRRACHQEGEFRGRKLLLVDDNTNGSYDDIGADSLFVEGESPQFLGRLMRIRDLWYEVRADPHGKDLRFRPWTGPTGRIRVGWKGRLEPTSLFVRGISEGNENAIIALEPGEEVEVPVGTYDFYFGQIRSERGRDVRSAEIRMGASPPIVVGKDATTNFEMGAPFRVSYSFLQTPDSIGIRGRDIRIHGRGGESYARFFNSVPLGEVAVKRVGGSKVATERVRSVDVQECLYDPKSAWFPRDVEIKKKKIGGGGDVMARFRLDSPLLGGIQSGFLSPAGEVQ